MDGMFGGHSGMAGVAFRESQGGACGGREGNTFISWQVTLVRQALRFESPRGGARGGRNEKQIEYFAGHPGVASVAFRQPHEAAEMEPD